MAAEILSITEGTIPGIYWLISRDGEARLMVAALRSEPMATSCHHESAPNGLPGALSSGIRSCSLLQCRDAAAVLRRSAFSNRDAAEIQHLAGWNSTARTAAALH